MIKKYFARVAAAGALFAVFSISGSYVLAQNVPAAEEFLPAGPMIVAEVELKGKISGPVKTLLNKFPEPQGDPFAELLFKKLKNGERFLFAMYAQNGDLKNPLPYVTVPFTDEEYALLTDFLATEEDFARGTVGDLMYYLKESDDVELTHYNGLLVVTMPGGLATMLNSAVTLEADAEFADFNAKTGGRFASAYFNVDELAQNGAAQAQFIYLGGGSLDVLKLFNYEGFAIRETTGGYKLVSIVDGNATELSANNFSLNPGGSFVPNLYRKFPGIKTLLYAEAYNFTDVWEQSARMLDQTYDGTFGEIEATPIGESASVADLFNMVRKEYAFAVQERSDYAVPVLTVMANVAGQEESARNIVNELKTTIDSLVASQDPEGAIVTSTTVGVGGEKTTQYTINTANIEAGAPNISLHVIFGVTTDGVFYLSTDPDLGSDYGDGLGQDFLTAYKEPTAPVTEIFYFNVRGLWDSIESVIEKLAAAGVPVDLDFLTGYYQLQNELYALRDIFGYQEASNEQATSTLMLGTDTERPPAGRYEAFVSGLKDADTDGDGLSNYDELHIHYTNPSVADTDFDGVMDGGEITAGTDPFSSEGFGFKDLPAPTWYSKEVTQLHKKGAISGYYDYPAGGGFDEFAQKPEFRAERNVTRCEFLAMLSRAYNISTPLFVEDSKIPFSDIRPDDWCSVYAYAAHKNGIAKGNPDGTFTGHNTITRAEVATMMGRASNRLKQMVREGGASVEHLPFRDVDPNAWYAGSVANVYAGEVMLGQAETRFAPEAFLNRAEAAVLIKRALDRDTEELARELPPVNEVFTPLAAPAAKSIVPGL